MSENEQSLTVADGTLIGGRPFREACIACGVADDHPRCDVQVATDGTWVSWHHDCHYRVKGDMPCHPEQETNTDGLTGTDLLHHLFDFHAARDAASQENEDAVLITKES